MTAISCVYCNVICFPLGWWGTFIFYKFLDLWWGTSIILKMKIICLKFLRWGFSNRTLSTYWQSLTKIILNNFNPYFFGSASPEIIWIKVYNRQTDRQILWHQIRGCANFFFLLICYLQRVQIAEWSKLSIRSWYCPKGREF